LRNSNALAHAARISTQGTLRNIREIYEREQFGDSLAGGGRGNAFYGREII
jgi:hypothetical protein